MSRTTTITEIEHRIEALQPVDQLKLLERMVRHLKRSLAGQSQTRHSKAAVSGDFVTARGALKQYADPVLREHEAGAFAQAMKKKHALR